jgi:hypothetical protein
MSAKLREHFVAAREECPSAFTAKRGTDINAGMSRAYAIEVGAVSSLCGEYAQKTIRSKPMLAHGTLCRNWTDHDAIFRCDQTRHALIWNEEDSLKRAPNRGNADDLVAAKGMW